jgi:hypothetical protein
MFALITPTRGRPRDEFRAPQTAEAFGIVIRPERRPHTETQRERREGKEE